MSRSSSSSSRGGGGARSSSSSGGRGGAATSSSSASTGPAWRTAPDSHSYQKNQKFHMSDAVGASEHLASSVPLLKPVFAKDVTIVPVKQKTKVGDADAAAASAAAAPVSSKSMKASAPISRAPVQVVDAGQMLKRYDEDAIALRAPKVKAPKVVAPPTEEDEKKSAAALRASFAVTRAEVDALGSTALSKWDRAVWQAKEDAAQGLKPLKGTKAPLKMYLGMEAKKEERAKRKREQDREQGLEVRAESSFSAAKKARALEAEEAADEAGGGWKMNIGRSHRGGVLSLRSSEIQSLTGRGGRGGGRGGFSRGGGRGGGGGGGRGGGRGRGRGRGR